MTDPVEEHREALETIAAADGPLADDCQRLLEAVEESGSE